MTRNWQGSAVFGEHPQLGRMRFRLDRWWGPGPRAVICMCNASTADGERNDPTIGRCIELLPDGIDGFTVVNWEPYIASKPADLYAWRDQSSRQHRVQYEDVRNRNLALIRHVSAGAPLRIVAWGLLVPEVPLTSQVLKALSLDWTEDLHAFGETKDGSPKHPMARGKHRIETGAPLVTWRVRRGVAA